MSAGLSKSERICSVKAVENLVGRGRYIVHSPLRACYLVRDKEDEPELNRILVSVPKKLFKRAVKRNLLKRRIREAYRLQKDLLQTKGVDIMFVFTSKEVAEFQEIYDSMKFMLETVGERVRHSTKS